MYFGSSRDVSILCDLDIILSTHAVGANDDKIFEDDDNGTGRATVGDGDHSGSSHGEGDEDGTIDDDGD